MAEYWRSWTELAWGVEGFKCGKCGCTKCYPITGRELVECAQCKKQLSPKSATPFRGCKLSTVQIVDGLVHFLHNRTCSARSMGMAMRVQWRTASHFITKCRIAVEKKHGLENMHRFINNVRLEAANEGRLLDDYV